MTRIQQAGQAQQESVEGVRIRTVLPIRIKRRGGRKHVIPAAHSPAAEAQHDAPILTALSRAFHWQRLIDEGVVESGTDIARREGLHHTTVNELLRLTLLSPRMVRAILEGRQPKTLSLLWLKNHAVPQDWAAQEALFDQYDA
ncbi:MAG: site-specific recombinase resolvase [Aromatoleum sp.]|jgi:hypothetical protein|uniref:site-specific recombinase resolvase n=1 Tax=Aromatoleum sp. TaxID=2307007 RepID=UPI0028939F97|nr:site-specific recombinase resolvase [Aromatoleum sp.]MDT3669637.1 site-specific recombinase resolvase [Aromatoleum sp.]